MSTGLLQSSSFWKSPGLRFHGVGQRQLNGMQALRSLRIEKVNPEVQHIQIEHLVYFLSSLRSLILVHQRCSLFLRVIFGDHCRNSVSIRCSVQS